MVRRTTEPIAATKGSETAEYAEYAERGLTAFDCLPNFRVFRVFRGFSSGAISSQPAHKFGFCSAKSAKSTETQANSFLPALSLRSLCSLWLVLG